MMFAFHSCRDTSSSYFHSTGNEEEMKTDISLINLQSYFLFCMLNKYELYYFEIRYRRQPCCSYGRLLIWRIMVKNCDPTKAVEFCFLNCISHTKVYRYFYMLVVRLFTVNNTGTTPVLRLRMCADLPLLSACLRGLRREKTLTFFLL